MGLVVQRFDPENASKILSCRKLELVENTLSDLWIALTRGLITTYMRGRAAGKIRRPFLAYLAGTIHNLLVTNAQSLHLLPRVSESSMLRALSRAKRPSTQRAHLARVKFHLWVKVEDEILALCPSDRFPDVYDHLYHIVDYFFEEYLPTALAASEYPLGPFPLRHLVSRFMQNAYLLGMNYIGTVTPYSSEEMTEIESPSRESDSEDDFLSILALRASGGII
jgi:hypothetical protein